MKSDDMLVALLAAMYYTHHEGNPLGRLSEIALNEEEVRGAIHSFLVGTGYDPYTSDGPQKLLQLASSLSSPPLPTYIRQVGRALHAHIKDIQCGDGVSESREVK